MSKEMTFDDKYKAIIRKDPEYEGIFITAVKTTGIFCRPVCTAKKPKPENVEFFSSTQAALLHGYRPCKICKPLSHENETPEFIADIIAELSKDPFLKIKDRDLVKRGIQPSNIRRWFKKHHGITFHAFQRMLRINTAYQKISMGETVTEAAFDIGYESMSGFNHGFQKIFGKSPGNAASKSIINISRFTTPLGPMFACATDKGICLLEFTNRRMLESEFRDLVKRLNAVILPGRNIFLQRVEEEILEYFEGRRKHFSIPLHTPGTEFQNAVWKILQDIPYGETRSYKQQAKILRKPKAIRAVAAANGMNRVAIIIPCHRVIGEDGSLTGYAGGLVKKKWLLDHEKKHTGRAVQVEIEFT